MDEQLNKERKIMKKIQLLSIMILSGAIAFGAQATAKKAQVNFKKAELVATESINTVALSPPVCVPLKSLTLT